MGKRNPLLPQRPRNGETVAFFTAENDFGKGENRMKAFFGKLLRFIKLDALLLGLLEKIALGLIKKITSLQYAAKELLDELLSPDNGVI